MNKTPSLRADARLNSWFRMFVISALLSLAVAGLGVMFPRQGWITWVFVALFVGLGWISPENRWGSVLGCTTCFVLLLYFVLPTEYGPAGQFWYTVGFFLFSTMFIVPSAKLSEWSR